MGRRSGAASSSLGLGEAWLSFLMKKSNSKGGLQFSECLLLLSSR